MAGEKNRKFQDEVYKELKVSFISVQNQIKAKEEEKRMLKFRLELYNKCLDDHLLEKGSKIIRQHLDEVKEEILNIDLYIDNLKVEMDAYRIELEVFEDAYIEKLQVPKKAEEEEE